MLSIVVAVLMLGSFGIIQDSFAITEDQINEKIKISDTISRPTFGLSHDNNKKIVDEGFSFNNKTFTITDNFHTPFKETPVKLGEVNSFDAKVFSEHGLRVQEFLFGIPIKGEAHLAELGIEVWYGLFGEIQEVKVVQKSNVIDINSVIATHEKTECTSRAVAQNCDITNISMVFLEPLQDKVMAIKAIDNENRYQITYLNEGFDISGESLNSMATTMIPSPERNEGLIQLTQTEKYSPDWITEDGRIFERNDFGSFSQINQSFERFQDTGEPKTRLHSGFGGVIAYEQNRATALFDASELISELPDFVPFSQPKNSERMNADMKQKMLEQEKICQKYLDQLDKQSRNY